MPKKPASEFAPALAKRPNVAVDPSSDFYSGRPSWLVGVMQMCSPWGWHEVDASRINKIHDKLRQFEQMTWKEILVDGKKFHHSVKLGRLTPDAQRHLESIFQAIDFDSVVSLRLGSTERVWGVLRGTALRLIWWDERHEVCPSLLRNT